MSGVKTCSSSDSSDPFIDIKQGPRIRFSDQYHHHFCLVICRRENPSNVTNLIFDLVITERAGIRICGQREEGDKYCRETVLMLGDPQRGDYAVRI